MLRYRTATVRESVPCNISGRTNGPQSVVATGGGENPAGARPVIPHRAGARGTQSRGRAILLRWSPHVPFDRPDRLRVGAAGRRTIVAGDVGFRRGRRIFHRLLPL